MPRTGGPGQQASPNPIKARPVTRATGIVMSASSSLSSNCPTSDGTISNDNPVKISATAAKTSTILITPILTPSQIVCPLRGNSRNRSCSDQPVEMRNFVQFHRKGSARQKVRPRSSIDAQPHSAVYRVIRPRLISTFDELIVYC